MTITQPPAASARFGESVTAPKTISVGGAVTSSSTSIKPMARFKMCYAVNEAAALLLLLPFLHLRPRIAQRHRSIEH